MKFEAHGKYLYLGLVILILILLFANIFRESETEVIEESNFRGGGARGGGGAPRGGARAGGMPRGGARPRGGGRRGPRERGIVFRDMTGRTIRYPHRHRHPHRRHFFPRGWGWWGWWYPTYYLEPACYRCGNWIYRCETGATHVVQCCDC